MVGCTQGEVLQCRFRRDGGGEVAGAHEGLFALRVVDFLTHHQVDVVPLVEGVAVGQRVGEAVSLLVSLRPFSRRQVVHARAGCLARQGTVELVVIGILGADAVLRAELQPLHDVPHEGGFQVDELFGAFAVVLLVLFQRRVALVQGVAFFVEVLLVALRILYHVAAQSVGRTVAKGCQDACAGCARSVDGPCAVGRVGLQTEVLHQFLIQLQVDVVTRQARTDELSLVVVERIAQVELGLLRASVDGHVVVLRDGVASEDFVLPVGGVGVLVQFDVVVVAEVLDE